MVNFNINQARIKARELRWGLSRCPRSPLFWPPGPLKPPRGGYDGPPLWKAPIASPIPGTISRPGAISWRGVLVQTTPAGWLCLPGPWQRQRRGKTATVRRKDGSGGNQTGCQNHALKVAPVDMGHLGSTQQAPKRSSYISEIKNYIFQCALGKHKKSARIRLLPYQRAVDCDSFLCGRATVETPGRPLLQVLAPFRRDLGGGHPFNRFH